ncbi:hypothetical protein CRUP_030419 [Coryphaenoides rupestris]|nr:hypothetical protein CRUP_030419 [Coryphaenoides rupestris]
MALWTRRYIYAWLLAVSSVAVGGKYVYVNETQTWLSARDDCRARFTELAPISSKRDLWEFHRAAGRQAAVFGWVGLYRDRGDDERWRWSGGGNASYVPWARGEPDNWGQTAVFCTSCWGHSYGLYEVEGNPLFSFFCLNLVVVMEERRTWEGALEYCRGQERELASLASDTELQLALREIHEAQTGGGERVWVGLRHFGARWLWLDRKPLGSEASLRMDLQAPPCSACNLSIATPCSACNLSINTPPVGQAPPCSACNLSIATPCSACNSEHRHTLLRL